MKKWRKQPTEPHKYEWGFALAGGAARCFAHLGALKAFAEAGITPNIISGTSAGAIAGAFIADGYDPDDILDFFEGMSYRDFVDLSILHPGISTTAKVQALIEKHLRARTFEELRLPLTITASDFDRGVPVHFTEGELLPPLLASCCVPIVFPPTVIDGTSYVDGGLFQNMPAAPIREKCHKLVGIDVMPVDNKPYGNSMRNVAERTISLVIASTIPHDRELCDIFICPREMTKYSMLDINHSKKISDVGYRAAKKTLAAMDLSGSRTS